MAKAKNEPDVARYADMFSAMGTEPRLRIMRLLLSVHPQGMIAGDVGADWRFRLRPFPITWKNSKMKIS
jgi:ArsR family transcriptional regulator, arsenate/arsenite/antimonite-responsive transcriptional repressor